MIPMIAKKAMPYRGREYRAGDRFDALPIDAAALKYQGSADFVPRDTSPAPPAEDEPSKGRRYRRRDLQAEE
jgi:hypothetical protein